MGRVVLGLQAVVASPSYPHRFLLTPRSRLDRGSQLDKGCLSIINSLGGAAIRLFDSTSYPKCNFTMTDQKDTDRGFDAFHPFVIKLTVPRPKWTTNAGQRESTTLTPKLHEPN